MVIIISRKGLKAERIDKSDFVNEKELELFINEHPDSILAELKEGTNFLTLNQFPTKVTGAIDVLGIDRDGDIYIVETKLIRNSDRRDVIAQALDYAAALMYEYTDLEFIDTLEEELAKTSKYAGLDLNSVLKTLFVDGASGNNQSDNRVTELMDQIKINLRNGNFKMIVLMDKVEDRLKDVISFMNQKSKFTFFAIDIGYYKYSMTCPADVDGNGNHALKIMVPNSYGLEVKKDAGLTLKLDENNFFEIAAKELTQEQLGGLRKIFDYSIRNGAQIHWASKSVAVAFPKVMDKTLFTITPNGQLQLYYGKLQPIEKSRFLKEFAKVPMIAEILDEKKGAPCYMQPIWLLSANEFINALKELQTSRPN